MKADHPTQKAPGGGVGLPVRGRIDYWDNLKGILIFLVVLGHFILNGTGWTGLVAGWIYLFHMPAFVFVAGYLTSRRSRGFESMFKLLLLYMVLQYGMVPFSHGIRLSEYSWTETMFSSWFLLALIIYRLTLPLIARIGWGLLAVALPLAVLVGTTREMEFFGMYKIIALWPFFITGALLHGRLPRTGPPACKWLQPAAWAGAVFFSTLGVFLLVRGNLTTMHLRWVNYRNFLDCAMRPVMLAFGGIGTACLLFLCPRGKIPFITEWGRNSLAVYVVHRPLALLFCMFFHGSAVWFFVAAVVCTVLIGNRVAAAWFNNFLACVVDGVLNRKPVWRSVLGKGVLFLATVPLWIAPAVRLYKRWAPPDPAAGTPRMYAPPAPAPPVAGAPEPATGE